MTSGYILIVAMLVLGGVLATLGDRIGTKVGKARLSLFNLRPRNTATVVTIITGSLISASTLGVLFATSGSLRDGIFELDSIKRKLRTARSDIKIVNAQKSQVESELAKARTQQADAQKRLDATNQKFQQAQTQLRNVSKQAAVLRSEIKSLLVERQGLIQQRDQLNNQISQLKTQVSQLQTQVSQLKELVAQRDEELAKRGQTINERNQELAQKNQTINERNQELTQKNQTINERNQELTRKNQTINERNQELAKQDQVIAERESRLQELEQKLKEAIAQREIRLQELEQVLTQRESELGEREKQLAFLQREVETLEQYYQNYQVLRQGNVALLRGQVLAFGVVRIVEPSAAPKAVEQLLREANRTAIETTRSDSRNSKKPLVQIPQTQVEQLINQIKGGQDYVVRILSAGNYVEGEKQVQVFADAALNQVIFDAGDVLATISTDASSMSNEEIRQRLDQLLAAARFRGRRAGILGAIQIGDGSPSTLIHFIEQLAESDEPLEVKAVAQEETNTAGPLKMQLVATQNGQVVFKS
jgi:uncharacterized protein (DUF3084 family)